MVHEPNPIFLDGCGVLCTSCVRIVVAAIANIAKAMNDVNQGGASFLTPYSTIGNFPTAGVNGTLASGDIKSGISARPVLSPIGLIGPLIGKPVTDLDNILKSKNAYATVRTVDHQRGEIQGQILPTSSTVSCLTTMKFAPPTTMPSSNNTRYY